MKPKKYRLKRPPILQPSRLVKYSNEHVFYEVEMFFKSIEARKAAICVTPQTSLHLFNMARIECFVLHLRNLIGFLYPDLFKAHSEDILAHHFLSGPSQWGNWKKHRPNISPILRKAKERADKEIAHLTTKRILGYQPHKVWQFVIIGNEVRNCLNAFVKAADPNRLGSNVKSAIPRGPL